MPRIVDRPLLKKYSQCPCIICGKMPSEGYPNDPHHRIPKSRDGDDVSENIVTLCRDCHAKHDECVGQAPSILPTRAKNYISGIQKWMWWIRKTHPLCPGERALSVFPEVLIEEYTEWLIGGDNG